jgi:tripartite-type tricarboxylate transporter receptor subunit TctC
MASRIASNSFAFLDGRLIHPSFPTKILPEFISYAKANPGKVNMASAGNGRPSHLAGELFKMMVGVNLVDVHYRGATPAPTDVLGGQVTPHLRPSSTSAPVNCEHWVHKKLSPRDV